MKHLLFGMTVATISTIGLGIYRDMIISSIIASLLWWGVFVLGVNVYKLIKSYR